VAFQESFWLATSAAAPVIALAAVVALPDWSTALEAASGLRAIASIRAAEAEMLKSSVERGETNASSLLEDMVYQRPGSNARHASSSTAPLDPAWQATI
jgi:hypothetical protein